MKKTFTILVILSLIGLGEFHLLGGPRMDRPMYRGDGGMMEMYQMLRSKQEELNITEGQLKKIKPLLFALEEIAVKSGNENNLMRLELQKQLMGKSKDYEKIGEIMAKISGNHRNLFIERLKTMETVEKILSPEQRINLKKIMKRNKDFRSHPQPGLMQPDFVRQPMRPEGTSPFPPFKDDNLE